MKHEPRVFEITSPTKKNHISYPSNEHCLFRSSNITSNLATESVGIDLIAVVTSLGAFHDFLLASRQYKGLLAYITYSLTHKPHFHQASGRVICGVSV